MNQEELEQRMNELMARAEEINKEMLDICKETSKLFALWSDLREAKPTNSELIGGWKDENI